MYVIFDGRSSTETNYDYIRFYKDDSHDAFWGENKYHGGRGGAGHNFPGVGERPPLRIPSSSFVIHFSSDSSNNDWGYKFVVCPTYGGSVWQTLRFDPSDECLALTDRLMESSDQLKEAALSPQELLIALNARNTFAANRLLDLGAFLDKITLTTFIGSNFNGGWWELLFDTHESCIALSDRLLESTPELKEATVTATTLFRALKSSKTAVANRLMNMGAALDDKTRAKLIGPGGDGTWRALMFDTSAEGIALSDRLVEFSPRLKEALSAMLVTALETRNADVANRLMGMGAVLDDHARSHFLGPLGDGGWHALFFESSPEIVALTDRLMDAYPRLKSGTVLARMLLAALNAQASATAARLLDLGAVLDRKALATVLQSTWRTLLFNPSDELKGLCDNLMASYPELKNAALSATTLLAALDTNRTNVANRLLEIGAALDKTACDKLIGSGDEKDLSGEEPSYHNKGEEVERRWREGRKTWTLLGTVLINPSFSYVTLILILAQVMGGRGSGSCLLRRMRSAQH